MATWLVPRTQLTTEQLRAVEMDTKTNHVVIGGPGSGKTIVLLHRADYLRQMLGTPPERFHIFVYTNVLKDYIASALEDLDLPLDCVDSLYSWCSQYYRAHIGRPPKNPETGLPHFSRIRNEVLEHLARTTKGWPLFDFIMVDEGQDLDGTAFDLFRVLARHVTVCMDHRQQIYEIGSTEEEAAEHLGIRRSDISLLGMYRCSRYIVELSAQFLEDSLERRIYLRQSGVADVNIETPVLYFAEDFDDERDEFIDVIRSRMKSDQIGVLLPMRKHVFGFAQALSEANIHVDVQDEIDFASNRPRLMTYQSAKGLTFDTVVMPRLISKSFPHATPELLARQLFVGVTRATKWVYMSTDRRWPLKELRCLYELEERGVLTIKRPYSPRQRGLFDSPEDESRKAPAVAKRDRDKQQILDLL